MWTGGGHHRWLQLSHRKTEKEDGEALISTILFDDYTEFLHDRVPLDRIKPMTEEDYYVRGCTALMDALGKVIKHISTIHKYAREEDHPSKTIFIITTDGKENASRQYSSERVKKMVEERKSKYGWEFLFLGANIDAVETAGHFGISKDRAVNYHSDSEGTALNYEVLSDAICSVRACRPLTAAWKTRIDSDFEKRKRR